jgi:hypothetical protein
VTVADGGIPGAVFVNRAAIALMASAELHPLGTQGHLILLLLFRLSNPKYFSFL